MKSDENIRQGAINKAIIPYLLEFRSRGVGCVIADQSPSKLMPSLRDQTALKLLFRIGGECAKMYTTSSDLQEFIMHQPQYHCVVMDGTRGELYLIRTHAKQK